MNPSLEYFNKNAQLSDEIARLMFTVNNYPELKIKPNFDSMHTELNNLEKTIDEQRRKYNEKVKGYNGKMTKFPYKIFRIKLKDLYETKYDRFENKY
jgi:LemA protein